ncbi:B12-binding domain-containing radical SAM protein [Dehalogenimonas etheniformans]|uniref:Radical SAM protein n=1 Tax=Dehalogenimonas etheniformans TaxID=1536648 RepID=A0A2P5P5V6_9CHLR|nr:radical SAM protein [Dehalogenimonas etheniformans]PPD57691.1 radical SAM protein [Dehalogenimonas etheniformans]QNT76032.1 B12-binding domain-containing radical SAM protein [Dehalogenimonas etheniformans]
MKVLLINAPALDYIKYYNSNAYTTFDYGLLSIAAVLEQHGHQVQIWDGFVDFRKAKDFTDFKPELVGFSVLAGPNMEGSISLSKEFRKLLPDAKIVWGDVHASVLPEQTLTPDYIDFVVVGAGEFTVLELVEHLEKGNANYSDIKGLGYKDNGKIIINERRQFIKDLESLPDPAWHLIDVKKYSTPGLNTSRGCVNQCTFCYNKSYNKGYTGWVSASRIIKQIDFLQEKYDIKYIRFNEDNFTFNRKRLREVCNLLIARKRKIKWSCDARADLSEADIALMAKSGCVDIGLGIESGSPRMLEFIKKDVTAEQMAATFWNFIKHKIRTSVYILCGMPTETIEDFNETQRFLEEDLDRPYYMFHRYVPFPGSAMYDYCVEHNLIEAPQKLEDWPGYVKFYGHKGGHLSQVPEEVIEAAVQKWSTTYAVQRFRFTLRHDRSYFWIIFKNPLKFLKELQGLWKYQAQVHNYHRTVVKEQQRQKLVNPDVLSLSRSGNAKQVV